MENFNSTTLEDWIPFGDGATSTCYYHRENPDLMLKFFDQGRTGSDYADREFSLSSAVWAMSVSTPRAIQVVSIEDKKARKWSLLFIVYTLAVESFSKFETWIVNLYINRCIRKL